MQDEAVHAQFRTAMAMLAGPAPQDLQQGIALIEAAASAGHAEALERRAVLECKGVERPADWEKALDSLAQAAELGSERAGRQLILLADDSYDPDAQAGEWREIRARISIAKRLRAPAPGGRTLSTAPLVHALPGMFSASECQWLIEAAAGRLERATVYNVPAGVHQGRTNQHAIFDLCHTDLVVEMVRARIADELGAPLPCLEISQVLSYEVGEEFVLHCDFLDPRVLANEIERFGQRSATFLIYLNEDFEGGETSFPRLGINHRGRTGDALVFANVGAGGMPDPRSQHAGRPPTRGQKWVFSQWVRDRYSD
jgi:hypothetical protein